MPKKTIKKKKKCYDKEQMKLALAKVRSGAMNKSEASRVYGIPRTTLLDRLAGRVDDECRSGPPTALPKEDEARLAAHVVGMANAGFPYTRKSLMLMVKQLLDEEGRRVTVFKDNMPGDYQSVFGASFQHVNLLIKTWSFLTYAMFTFNEFKF